jgi:hypothetical protein
MRKFIIFATLCFSSWVAFAQTNIVKEGYWKVMVADTLYSQHNDQSNAFETMINLQLTDFDVAVKLLPPTYRVDVEYQIEKDPDTIYVDVPSVHYDTVFIETERIVYVNDTIYSGGENYLNIGGVRYFEKDVDAMINSVEIDTMTVTECFEDYNQKTWLWTSPESVWIPFKEIGLSHVTIDSMPIWKKKYQDKYLLERTINRITMDKSYKELEMPFQFFHDSIVSIQESKVIVRVFATEDWHPTLEVDDQTWIELPDAQPGTQDFDGFNTRRHTCTFNGLSPQTTYTLAVRGYSRLRKEEDIVYFTVTTK